MPNPGAAAFLVLVLILATSRSESAEISAHHNDRSEPTGCAWQITGPIQAGDVAVFSEYFANYQTVLASERGSDSILHQAPVACLDSRGGNFREGVLLGEFFRKHFIATRIEPNKRCYSACAIAFMGGATRIEVGRGYAIDRSMHPTSQLGFHAPYIRFEGDRSDDLQLNAAYARARQTIGFMIERAAQINLSIDLIHNTLQMAHDELYMVNTVDRLSKYQVSVYGYALNENARNSHSCVNAFSARWQEILDTTDKVGGFDVSTAEAMPSLIDDEEYVQKRTAGLISDAVIHATTLGEYPSYYCRVESGGTGYGQGVSDSVVYSCEDGARSISDDDCYVRLDGVPVWQRFSFDTTLAEIPTGEIRDRFIVAF